MSIVDYVTRMWNTRLKTLTNQWMIPGGGLEEGENES